MPSRSAVRQRLLVALAVFGGLVALVLMAPRVPAQQAREPQAAEAAGDEARATPGDETRESPRDSLTAFLELCRRGEHAAAARYLDLPASRQGEGSLLARRLKAVLDRHVWFDLHALSDEPDGDAEDGLAPGIEEIGAVPGPSGSDEPVRMTLREVPGAGSAWVFSQATVERIDAWYARLGHTWAAENLPAVLLRPGPFDILYWQWLGLPLLVLAAWTAALLLRRVTTALLARLAARTSAAWDDEIVAGVGGPLTLGWMVVVLWASVPWLGLYEPAEEAAQVMMRAAFFVTVFWALLRAVTVGTQVVLRTRWAERYPASRALVPLLGRIVKIIILLLAVVAILDDFGFPVASLIAGLGVGGLALALAAQKTVENVFGAFSIGLDETVRVGDFVRIGDDVGTVESIGMRSTRVRSLDRTLVTWPNGKLVEARIESFGARDRFRLAATIGVTYGTTAPQMRQIIEGFKRVMREHHSIWPDAIIARFVAFGDSSQNIEVMCWFQVADFNAFCECRQEVLLSFMDVVEAAGSGFAFPTRTVHLVQEKAGSEKAGAPGG